MRRCFLGPVMACALLGGCAVNSAASWAPPKFAQATPGGISLLRLPPPPARVPVAVYGFADLTGQFKPTENVQTLSRAVTQGATPILIKALQDAGNKQWFQIVERERLDDLLRERAVIREMRSTYLGEKTPNAATLPPLVFAGVILEGGVVGFDANVKTGGVGARFLGIGANTSYREDTVTVYLRAVSTRTGEVLLSVNTRKSIASVLVSSNTFRYVGFQDLLEVDGGYTANEPGVLALQQAIEKAVYGLVMEGAEQRLWCLRAPPEQAAELLRGHIAERDHLRREDARLPVDAAGHVVDGACAAGAPVAAHISPEMPTSTP